MNGLIECYDENEFLRRCFFASLLRCGGVAYRVSRSSMSELPAARTLPTLMSCFLNPEPRHWLQWVDSCFAHWGSPYMLKLNSTDSA